MGSDFVSAVRLMRAHSNGELESYLQSMCNSPYCIRF